MQRFFGTDGETFEFEWYIFSGRTTVGLLIEIQIKMTTRGIRPERIIFMSIFNDIDWTKIGNYKKAFFFFEISNGERLRKEISIGTLVFSRSWWRSTLKVNEQSYRILAPEEVKTLVQALETHVQAARNRLRDH